MRRDGLLEPLERTSELGPDPRVGTSRVFRVDQFIVPGAVRAEFGAALRATHEMLRTRPGFRRDFLLERISGPGDFNFITVVEWDDEQSLEDARVVVAAVLKRRGLDRHNVFARLGIRTDLGHYRQLPW